MLLGINLLPGDNLHSGAKCAHEQGLSLSYNYLAGSLINVSVSFDAINGTKSIDFLTSEFLQKL